MFDLLLLLFFLTASLEDSLWFLHKYIGDAGKKNEALDQVLIPMIEHVTNFSIPIFLILHVILHIFG